MNTVEIQKRGMCQGDPRSMNKIEGEEDEPEVDERGADLDGHSPAGEAQPGFR